MATFNLKVPNKNLPGVGQQNYSTIKTKLTGLKDTIGSIVKECSAMSNIPEELIYSFIVGLSNGVNNTAYQTRDLNPALPTTYEPLVRSGYFALSNKIAKIVLCHEMVGGEKRRMSTAELSYLRNADPVLASYLSDDKGRKGFNEHWSSDWNAGVDKISDKINPINLLNPKVSIAIGTMWIGQLWDKFSAQTSNPLDKVIISIFLPYKGKAQTWNGANNWVQLKDWNADYTLPKNKDTLPKPENKMSSGNIINPNGGWVGDSLNVILGEGGTLWSLTA